MGIWTWQRDTHAKHWMNGWLDQKKNMWKSSWKDISLYYNRNGNACKTIERLGETARWMKAELQVRDRGIDICKRGEKESKNMRQ